MPKYKTLAEMYTAGTKYRVSFRPEKGKGVFHS